jgi:hypothetical protein
MGSPRWGAGRPPARKISHGNPPVPRPPRKPKVEVIPPRAPLPLQYPARKR